jgi:hypothetical protein
MKKPFFSTPVLHSWQRSFSVMLGMAFLLGIAYFSSCKKENASLDPTAAAGGITQSRTDGDCANFPELVGVSYQTVRYNSSEQIAEMYGNLVAEQDIAAVADQAIDLHLTQGQQAALTYLQTELGATPEEISILNNFLNQVVQIDFENLNVNVIEDFANDYRSYLCSTTQGGNNGPGIINPGNNGPGIINPGNDTRQEAAQNTCQTGSILVHTVEGALKGLVKMQDSKGADERTQLGANCEVCAFVLAISISYYSFSGGKYGFAVGGPVGAKIGKIAGALYGSHKGLKSPACKTCLKKFFEDTPDCANPSRIAILPVSCDEVRCMLDHNYNLPSSFDFNWFMDNSLPIRQTTVAEEARILVPNPQEPTEVVCYYQTCGTGEDDVSNSFHLFDDFLNMESFSLTANNTNITAQGSTEILVTPDKTWNSNLYTINYSSDMGYLAAHSDPNLSTSPIIRVFRPYGSSGSTGIPGGSGSSNMATITVTITNICLGTSITKDIKININ